MVNGLLSQTWPVPVSNGCQNAKIIAREMRRYFKNEWCSVQFKACQSHGTVINILENYTKDSYVSRSQWF